MEGSAGPSDGRSKLTRLAADTWGHVWRALVVDSALKAIAWLSAAALSALQAAAGLVSHVSAASAAALAVALTVPPLVGAATWWSRRGVSRRRKAEERATQAEAEVRELKRDLAVAQNDLQSAQQDRDEAVQTSQLALDVMSDAHGERLLQSPDPRRAVERWMYDHAQRLLRVVFRQPDSRPLGLGVFRYWEGMYHLTHDAGVPEVIADRAPARARRGFVECIQAYAPHAEAFPFQVDGEDHWLVVFPDAPALPHPAREPILAALASTLKTWLLLVRETS